MKCTCGNEMLYVKSYGNNYDEPEEKLYRCPVCGQECWIDYCSVSWKNEKYPTYKELVELKENLYEYGKVDLSNFTCPEDIKWDIEKLGEKEKLKTRLEDNELIFVECWEVE